MVHTEGENNRIEIWKDYKDYEGLYQASNLGRMRSLDRWVKSKSGSVRLCKGKILKLCTDKYGYLNVGLWKNNKVKTYLVHRIIAETFLPNSDNLPCVNHKDENKLNNNAENLEWCSSSYNINFGTRNEKVAEKNTNGKQCKPILQYTLDGKFVREWKSAKQAEREGGFNQSHITHCCIGERKKHHNFIWKYK